MDLVDITDGSGNAASPVLPEHVKNYLIDIDGTIGEDIPNEEPERMATAEAYPDAIETINRWYDEGHQICFFTARTEDHRTVTPRHGWRRRGSSTTHCSRASRGAVTTTGSTTTSCAPPGTPPSSQTSSGGMRR